MAQELEGAIVKLRAALRAAAWADHELTSALVREARDACDEWLARAGEAVGQGDLAEGRGVRYPANSASGLGCFG